MKVLIVGGGGREHALAWAVSRSPRLSRLFVAPGNAGTGSIAKNVAINADDVAGLVGFVLDEDIDLTIAGPEAPLVAGLADDLAAAGRRCFGPSRNAARLEGSKAFAKAFMAKHRIPTAQFETFDDAAEAEAYVRRLGRPVVVKADGLAQGKGVIVTDSAEEALTAIRDIMVNRRFGGAGDRVVVEERLEGPEVSVHAICGGGRAVLFPFSQDHKRALDDDRGPNTGGMGAYAPVPFVSSAQCEEIKRSIVDATLDGMASDGSPFSGLLYAGLMMTDQGPKVLEYNVRFGDPETQALLPLMKSDPLEVLDGAAGGTLPDDVAFHPQRCAATVVMASRGYPGAYEKGYPITGLENAEGDNRAVFHAGTRQAENGTVTAGGRVLSVTAWGDDLGAAIRGAYDGVAAIHFDGAHWRRDIGRRAL